MIHRHPPTVWAACTCARFTHHGCRPYGASDVADPQSRRPHGRHQPRVWPLGGGGRSTGACRRASRRDELTGDRCGVPQRRLWTRRLPALRLQVACESPGVLVAVVVAVVQVEKLRLVRVHRLAAAHTGRARVRSHYSQRSLAGRLVRGAVPPGPCYVWAVTAGHRPLWTKTLLENAGEGLF